MRIARDKEKAAVKRPTSGSAHCKTPARPRVGIPAGQVPSCKGPVPLSRVPVLVATDSRSLGPTLSAHPGP